MHNRTVRIDLLPLAMLGVAYLVTLAAERLFDLGVVAALVLGVAGLFTRMRWLAAAIPLLGLTHADPQWWRTTIALYVAYAVIAAVVLRRKSTPLADR